MSQTRRQTEPACAAIRFSASAALMFFFIGLAAIALAYVAGVMKGRQELAAASKSAVEKIKLQPLEARAVPAGEILKPEQLEFARELRGGTQTGSAPEKPREAAPEPPAPKAPIRGAEASDTPAERAPGAAETETAAAAPENSEKMFDFVFLVAAFRDEASADEARQSLEGHGWRTGLEKNGRMFIVLARVRGAPRMQAELEALCARLRLGIPLARSRKPVSP